MLSAEAARFVGRDDLTLAEAMQRIDQNARGIIVLVDEEERLVGTLTDGDIRRFLLAGGKMEERARRAANRSPRSAASLDEAAALYRREGYAAIPIIDEGRAVIDIYIRKDAARPLPALHVPVVINAGGKGTRLDPYTRVLPKPLVPIGDLPIIEHIMRQFMGYGCSVFHVIVNYKKQLMKAYFSENDNPYDITWYDEEKPLGTGGGLSLLKGRMTGTFFFSNCDIILLSNYEGMLNFHRENGNAITMVCAHKNVTLPYGVIEMGKQGRIENFREKPVLSFLTNTGMYIVEPEVVDDIEGDTFLDFPNIIERQRQKGRNVAAYPVSENDWLDMGQLPELEKMRERLYGE